MTQTADYRVQEPLGAVLALRGDLLVTPESAAGRQGCVIEDPLQGKFYRVGLREYFFLTLLDGRRTIAAALGLAASRGGDALAEHEALALCRWLVDCQLATTRQSTGETRLQTQADRQRRRRWMERLNPLAVKIRLVNPDGGFDRLRPLAAWLFSRPALAAWLALCAWAVYLAATEGSRLAGASAVILSPENWWRLAAAWVVLKLLHETCHGLACKHFGGHVPEAGLMILLLAPLAYVDVTSSWRFRDRWQRIITAAAGMYVELATAALAIIAWAHTAEGTLHYLCFDVAVMAGLQTLLFNANPLVRFDGYFILADLVQIPNLASCGQQYLGELLKRYVLGWEYLAPTWSRRQRAWIGLYAGGALAWRWFLTLTLSLTLVSVFSYGGALAAAVLVFYWQVLPAIGLLRSLAAARSGQPVRKGRLLSTAALVAGVLGLIVLFFERPAVVAAPAVVEYSPLTILRAKAPGFVRAVLVRSGDAVVAGQVILRLENEDIEHELRDLELAWQQSVIKGRMYAQDEQLAKCQMELSNQESLAKKQRELQAEVETLTVRAPRGGRVVGRNLESLAGQYLQRGTQIAVIGQEDAKELVIAAAQEDLHSFLAQLGKPLSVEVRGGDGPRFESPLLRVDPRAACAAPHPALAARVGGPLPVRPQAAHSESPDKQDPGDELLSPRFPATARLSPAQSTALAAGQVGWVRFRAAGETRGARLAKAVDRWIRQQLARRAP